MADPNSQSWEFFPWIDLDGNQHIHSNQPPLSYEEYKWWIPAPETEILSDVTDASGTPGSSDSLSIQRPSSDNSQSASPKSPNSGSSLKKRQRQASEDSQSENSLTRRRKTRKLRAPLETAKVRERGACFLCQKKRKECQDGNGQDGSCKRCLEHPDMIAIPGLLRPLCWRPNIGSTEVFRRGPTIDFAASRRGNNEDAGPGKQALWKQFSTRKIGSEPSRVVQLSQEWTTNTLNIPLDRYQPTDTDKQHYTWLDDGVEQRYKTASFGIAKANLGLATSMIERFLVQNSESYIEAHMKVATELTRNTFQTAQQHKSLPLVERALKLWVACRFIEKPWSITGSETLGMSKHANLNCPYHTRIPVPPIVDLQIDLIVINEILQPELKKILKMLKVKLESTDPWTDWFEIYLTYFILLHNIELTMAHDAWFVKRNNLKKRYSNKPLVDTITQGATTLLTCFHYAHQGYAPFTNLDLERTERWPEKQKEYLRDARPLLQSVRGDHVQDPAKELFWTSQLHRSDWRPVVLIC
ncbi:hypothetical protein VTL71DRAFT_136 [Oculimacula yallundae]|uniref:Zn(2)-C6 fungal-type domain-containing protein n=1 Tax=Oculimacula yallundae TaxID=86028 RepID=A0ABR4CZ59_9HELO